MANAFKRKSVTAGTSSANILASNVAASTEVVVIGLIASNKTATTANVTIEIIDSTATYSYGTDLPVPAGSSLSLLENKIVLMTGDNIKAKASVASAIDVTMSYLEIT